MIDKLLERVGLKYDDLNPGEKETLNTWLDAIQKSKVTIETLRDHITAMKQAVEQELTKTTNNNKQDVFLKARLRNYLLLEAFLTTPEKAQAQLEQAVSGLASPIDKKQ